MEGARLQSEPGPVRPRLRRIAAAGNTAAVTLLVLVFAHGPALLGKDTEESPAPLPGSPTSPVLLVVIDALRDDRSRDPALMPHLNRLAREGGRGTARVESWIPSTVAGIRTIVEGRVPPPASFLEDFGASPSRNGGIFAAVPRAYAAGPRLWEDLYGPWLAGSFSVLTVAADDERVLREGIAALRSGQYDLVVVHLSGTDDVTHLHDGKSRQYLDALRQADARLGRLLAAAPSTVIVTSDHGVTDRGGHAGPEPEVVITPLVVRGPGLPRGDFGSLRQRDLHRLIVPLPKLASSGRPGAALPLLSVLAALTFALILSGRLARGREEWPAAVWLDATLWIALIAAVFAGPRLALVLLLGALAVAVFRGEGRVDWTAVLPLLTAGWAFGALRLLDGHLPAIGLLPRGARGLLAACALAACLGWALRRLLSRPLALGWLCGLLPALLLRLPGETASLSTLDVRFAFRLVDGPFGLPGAVTAVVLSQALPALALLLGLVPALARSEPEITGAFAAGLALSLAGQGTAAALALTVFPENAVAGSLAVGLLVRLLGEATYLFLGLAGLTTALERSRRPVATSR